MLWLSIRGSAIQRLGAAAIVGIESKFIPFFFFLIGGGGQKGGMVIFIAFFYFRIFL